MSIPTPAFFQPPVTRFDDQSFKERLSSKLADLCELIDIGLGPEYQGERCLILIVKDKSPLNETYELEVLFQPELDDAFIEEIRKKVLNNEEDTDREAPSPTTESALTPYNS